MTPASSHQLLKSTAIFFLVSLMTACGSGGGGGTSPTTSSSSSSSGQVITDTKPAAFNLGNQSGVQLNTDIFATSITVAEINAAAPISIDGGYYSVGGSDYIDSETTVNNGEQVTVRLRSSTEYDTETTATLTIGGVSAIFTVRTLADEAAPTGSIDFPPPSSMTESDTVTVRGSAMDELSGVESVNITVNGSAVELINTDNNYQNWDTTATLIDGDNNIVVTYVDVAGNSTEPMEVIIRKAPIDDGSDESAYPNTSDGFLNPISIAYDSRNNRFLVGDGDLDAIIAVDANSGARSEFSGPTKPNSNDPFQTPEGILIDPSVENDRFWVSDKTTDAIYEVSLTDGARNIISSDMLPNEDDQFNSPREMIISPFDDTQLLVSDQFRGVKGVGVSDGLREVFSDDSFDGVPNLDNPFGNVEGIIHDTIFNRLLVVDQENLAVVEVSLSDGARTPFSSNTLQANDIAFSSPSTIALDELGERVFVNDQALASIISVNLETGARMEFSSATVPNSSNSLISPQEVLLDSSLGYLLVADAGLNALIAIDKESGERVIFSKGVSCSSGAC